MSGVFEFWKNYEGAPDEMVYVYSQDGPGAYEPNDSIVLARVNQKRVREKEAYEFFAGIGGDGVARWERAISKRRPVFSFHGHCGRVDAVYSRGLGRYLLAVSYGHQAGWGLFDAPHPWGPWTAAFSTDDWGLGVVHGFRLPGKWISEDGLRMWVVFSGIKPNDAFCVRGATVELYK